MIKTGFIAPDDEPLNLGPGCQFLFNNERKSDHSSGHDHRKWKRSEILVTMCKFLQQIWMECKWVVMFPHLSKRLSQDRHESQINFFIAVAHLYSLSTRRGTSQMKMLERRERTIIKHLSKQPVKWGAGGERGLLWREWKEIWSWKHLQWHLEKLTLSKSDVILLQNDAKAPLENIPHSC